MRHYWTASTQILTLLEPCQKHNGSAGSLIKVNMGHTSTILFLERPWSNNKYFHVKFASSDQYIDAGEITVRRNLKQIQHGWILFKILVVSLQLSMHF